MVNQKQAEQMTKKVDFESIRTGDALPEVSLAVSQAMINEYAQISGDFNPLHVDVEFAAKSEFKGTIAHGCIPVEPILKSVCIWIGRPWYETGTKMQLRYRAPTRPGDTISSEARVIEKKVVEGKKTALIEFVCKNQNANDVITGSLEVLI